MRVAATVSAMCQAVCASCISADATRLSNCAAAVDQLCWALAAKSCKQCIFLKCANCQSHVQRCRVGCYP